MRFLASMAEDQISEDDEQPVIQITVPKAFSFLQSEEHIQNALNDARRLVTGKGMKDVDADSSPIPITGHKRTAKRTKVAGE